jgi:hypothetical protein
MVEPPQSEPVVEDVGEARDALAAQFGVVLTFWRRNIESS